MSPNLCSDTLDFVLDGVVTTRMAIYTFSELERISDADAAANGEEPLQFQENGRYEYELDSIGKILLTENGNGIINPSGNPLRSHCGVIEIGLYTGQLALLVQDSNGSVIGRAAVEVTSRKVDYRYHYRKMLEDITDHTVSLLMELRSPTAARMAPDPGKSPETIHQRFAFLRALIGSRQFRDALHRVTIYPHRRWESEEMIHDIRRGFRPDVKSQRELAKGVRRFVFPSGHPLAALIPSLPEKVPVCRNIQTDDTQENRFVKFVLQTFSVFLNSMRHRLEDVGKSTDVRLCTEIMSLEAEVGTVLTADIFRGVSDPDLLPLGSPVLQRKEGYREVLQAWLKFDMAARLVWHGGDDVYGAGQKDLAVLYEYWVFFKLLGIVSEVFNLEKPAVEELIEATGDGFGLKLKSGKHLAIKGTFASLGRILKMEFSYNRTFCAGEGGRSASGSWTKNLRPDYTLSIWPEDFSPEEAESQELMVHLHFDAKYRVDRLTELFGGENVDEEEKLERTGTWKRADLLKMHAYRDAIRRTQGAYILYPGDDTPAIFYGFREILPGLGAFVLKPGSGDEDVSRFIRDVVQHVCDRATDRERQAYHVFQVHEGPAPFQIRYPIPEREPKSVLRHSPPEETHVLIGWCHGEEHRKWIIRHKLYNCRINTSAGSLRLKPEIAGAKYVMLHGSGTKSVPGLLRISSEGPRVITKEELEKKGYPGVPHQDHYLIFDVEPAAEFDGIEWEYPKLESRQEGRKSAWPYSVTLSELLSLKRSSV